MTETKREEIIHAIADCWVDGIDIKDLLRQQYYEFTEQLDAWSDKDLKEEYELTFGKDEQESQRN